MQEAITKPMPFEEAARGGDCPPVPSNRLHSLDFRGRNELDWCAIEDALHKLGIHAVAVEMVGRNAQDNIQGEGLTGVFDFLSEEIVAQLKKLEELLGLNDEGARS